jgi:hypothetical protein
MIVSLGGVGPQVDRELGLDSQEITPLHSPVVGEFVAGEELVDEEGALVGVLAVEKFNGLGGGREGAGDIYIQASEENGVGGEVGGPDSEFLPTGKDEIVDLVAGGERTGSFEGREGLGRQTGAKQDEADEKT